MSLKDSFASLNERTANNPFPIPFSFPAKLHIVCLTQPTDPSYLNCKNLSIIILYVFFNFSLFFLAKPLLQRLIDMSGYDGSILIPEQLNETSTTTLFQKLAEDMYASFRGVLKCGNLEAKVILSPAPVVSINSALFIFIN